MKTTVLRYWKNCLAGLLLSCLAATVWTSRGMIKRVWDHLREKPKDAAVVVANDSDQTMIGVFSEFITFHKEGYRDNAYPALDQLYHSRETWHTDSITRFSTSMKMQSYGADQAVSTTGDWQKLTALLEDAIAGYQQFVPLRQETSAITYVEPCLIVTERIAKSETLTIPADVRQHLLEQMTQLRKLIIKAPDESTNHFKQQALSSIENTITALQKR